MIDERLRALAPFCINKEKRNTNGFLQLSTAIDYLSFQRLHVLEPYAFKVFIDNWKREVRSRLNILWANFPKICVNDLYGISYIFHYDAYIEDEDGQLIIWDAKGTRQIGHWNVSATDVAQRKEVFKEAVQRCQLTSEGKKPCFNCAEVGDNRSGLSVVLCITHFEEHKARNKTPCAYDENCKEAYIGHCVCNTKNV